MPLKTSKNDLRCYNSPPVNNAIKRFDTTVSFRIERELVDELELLLSRRYGLKNVPMRKLSFVLRSAVKKRINTLKQELNEDESSIRKSIFSKRIKSNSR
jgi:hypothetical protein